MVTFISGNPRKIENLHLFLKPYDATFESASLPDLLEIQSHDMFEVAKHKGVGAYDRLQKPVIINDGGWSIPALKGFPGPYMKDVNQWLSPEDIWNMMKDKEDKSIFLTDIYVGVDREGEVSVFSAEFPASFVPPAVDSKSLDDIVIFNGATTVISKLANEERSVIWGKKKIWSEIGEWVKGNS